MGLLESAVVSVLPLLPRPLMRTLSAKYIPGEELSDAIRELRSLRDEGFTGILDILGEDVLDETAARAVVDAYTLGADAIVSEGLDAYLSVKPTHVGLKIAESLALELYDELAERAKERNLFLRVEMEDHTTTDATLRVFRTLRAKHDNVGIVLQSRLFRTPADIDAIPEGPLSVRMVKGVYLEPASIAHTDPEPIREAFLAATRQLFERGAFVSIATHDDVLANRVVEYCLANGIGTDRYEFQVLLGVRRPLWHEWREAGHPVRVYVPFGPEWRAYSTRRLRKNPEILRHVMRDFFSLGRG